MPGRGLRNALWCAGVTSSTSWSVPKALDHDDAQAIAILHLQAIAEGDASERPQPARQAQGDPSTTTRDVSTRMPLLAVKQDRRTNTRRGSPYGMPG